jgi:conjugative transfer signal peptidase TraF
MKLPVLILSPVFSLILLVLIGGLAGYRINPTASMPVGLWKKSSVVQRASYVAFCIPPDSEAAQIAHERGYLPPGQCPGSLAPLLKRVEALPGDMVLLTNEAAYINGMALPNSRTQGADSQGRPLSSFPRGSYRVLPGQYWVFATPNPNSFDSRYFGPVPETSIETALVPVAVFELCKP